MRLRHTKPISSYAGQTYNSSNVQNGFIQELKDEQYFKNAQSNRKGIFDKPRTSADQMALYAELLCRFVNSVNEGISNLNSASKEKNIEGLNFGQKQKRSTIQKAHESRGRNGRVKKNFSGKQQKVVYKMQQRVLKAHKNIYTQKSNCEPNEQSRATSSKKKLQNKANPLRPPSQDPQPQRNTVPSTTTTTSTHPVPHPPQPTSIYNLYTANSLHQQYYMQQLLKNSFPSLSPYQLQYQYYQPLPPQPHLKSNPFTSARMPNTQLAPPPAPNQENPLNKQSVQYVPLSRSPFSVGSKSMYHVAIAYNIHLARFKQKGRLPLLSGPQFMEQLDPTYPAKKLKMLARTSH